jgi:hypothetical protein
LNLTIRRFLLIFLMSATPLPPRIFQSKNTWHQQGFFPRIFLGQSALNPGGKSLCPPTLVGNRSHHFVLKESLTFGSLPLRVYSYLNYFEDPVRSTLQFTDQTSSVELPCDKSDSYLFKQRNFKENAITGTKNLKDRAKIFLFDFDIPQTRQRPYEFVTSCFRLCAKGITSSINFVLVELIFRKPNYFSSNGFKWTMNVHHKLVKSPVSQFHRILFKMPHLKSGVKWLCIVQYRKSSI